MEIIVQIVIIDIEIKSRLLINCNKIGVKGGYYK